MLVLPLPRSYIIANSFVHWWLTDLGMLPTLPAVMKGLFAGRKNTWRPSVRWGCSAGLIGSRHETGCWKLFSLSIIVFWSSPFSRRMCKKWFSRLNLFSINQCGSFPQESFFEIHSSRTIDNSFSLLKYKKKSANSILSCWQPPFHSGRTMFRSRSIIM